MKTYDETLEVLVRDSYQGTLQDRSDALEVAIKFLIKELNVTLETMEKTNIEKTI